MKKIPVNKKIWRKLCKIKNERDLNTLSQAVEYLFDHQSFSKEETVQEAQGSNLEKILQYLDERTQTQIQKIKADHHLDSFARVLRYLIDVYNIFQTGERHQKLEEKTTLAEIERHVDDLIVSANAGLECQCHQCSRFFKLDLSQRDPEGVMCPCCGSFFGFAILGNGEYEEPKTEVLPVKKNDYKNSWRWNKT